MSPADPLDEGDAGAGVPGPPDTGVGAKAVLAPTEAGSGLPMLTAGAAPRAAAEGKLVGEIVSPVMRISRGFSGVAISPPATAVVPAAV